MTGQSRVTTENKIPYILYYVKRRTLKITLDPYGRVLAYAPKSSRIHDIDRFIDTHSAWIEKNRVKVLSLIDIPYCDEEEQKRRTLILKAWASSFLEKYPGKKPNRIAIKNMSGRWGSCSAKGNINLTVYLLDVDEPLREYVMYHELSHLYYLNHSSKFWEQVRLYCPDYSAKRKALQRYRLPKKPS